MNNDNDLNLHFHDQMSGWLRYTVAVSGPAVDTTCSSIDSSEVA